MKDKRTAKDKLHTLLFGKDLRITEGEPYTEIREGDFSSYYPEEEYIKEQSIPKDKVYDIMDYGAKPDDKEFDNAKAINEAIDQCSEDGGGYVLIKGGQFTSTTVFLKSNVILFIDKESSLIANGTGEGYSNRALIFADGCENIGLTGGGRACGNGNLFGRKPAADENMLEAAEMIDVIQMRIDYRSRLRFAHPSKFGSICRMTNCRNVKVFNFIFKNSADWTFRLHKCNFVDIKDTIINNNRHVCNADGFDMVQSSDVNINHCFISTSDDGIVIKNAIWEQCDGEMENISISDCEIISATNAIKVGTETTYDIHDITITDCHLFMTDLYPGSVSGISIETSDGSKVYNITAKDIVMDRCTCPIFIRLNNRNRASEVNEQSARAIEYDQKPVGKPYDKDTFDKKGELHDVVIENVTATDVELPIIVAGYKEKGMTKRIKNVTLKNFDITYRNAKEVVDKRLFIPEYVKVYPECWRFRNLPAYGIWARHVENFVVDNFKCVPAPETWKKEIVYKDVIKSYRY